MTTATTISHRQEIKDGKFRKRFVPVPDKPVADAAGTTDEGAIFAAMMNDAVKMRGKGKRKHAGNNPRLPMTYKLHKKREDDISPAIIEALRQQNDEIAVPRIAELVGVILGRRVSPQTIRDRMKCELRDSPCIVARNVGQRFVLYRISGAGV